MGATLETSRFAGVIGAWLAAHPERSWLSGEPGRLSAGRAPGTSRIATTKPDTAMKVLSLSLMIDLLSRLVAGRGRMNAPPGRHAVIPYTPIRDHLPTWRGHDEEDAKSVWGESVILNTPQVPLAMIGEEVMP
jgi:hypothetical protein